MKLKELLEKRASLFEEVQQLAKLDEITDEQRSEFSTKRDELDNLDKDINFEKSREEMREMSARAIEEDANNNKTTPEEMRKQYEVAFRGYMMGNMSDDQKSVLSRANKQNTTAALGGYTIPEGFSGMLEKAMLYYTPFDESLITIWRTATGNDIPYPTTNDTGNKAYLLAEGGDATSSAKAAEFGSVTFKAYKFTSGMVAVSYELLADSDFDMGNVLAQLFGERMGRGLATSFTTGTGSSQPQGVVTGAATGNTAAAAAAISRDDIVNLIGTCDPLYAQNGTLMFNNDTFTAIKLLDNGTADARPLYQVSAIAGEPALIEGHPFVINNDMADIGTGNISMLFGDFKKFVVRFAGVDRMVVDHSVFVKTDEVGMGLFKRVDSHVLNAGTNPIVKLTHP